MVDVFSSDIAVRRGTSTKENSSTLSNLFTLHILPFALHWRLISFMDVPLTIDWTKNKSTSTFLFNLIDSLCSLSLFHFSLKQSLLLSSGALYRICVLIDTCDVPFIFLLVNSFFSLRLLTLTIVNWIKNGSIDDLKSFRAFWTFSYNE